MFLEKINPKKKLSNFDNPIKLTPKKTSIKPTKVDSVPEPKPLKPINQEVKSTKPKKPKAEKIQKVEVDITVPNYMDYSMQLKDGLDIANRVIYLDNDIDESEHIRFFQKVKTILTLGEESKKPITLIINTPGGYIYPAFAIIDIMEELKTQAGILVNTYALGYAASAGFLLLLAGTGLRTCNKNCLLLAHELQHTMNSVNTSQLKLDMEKSDFMVEEYVNLLQKNSNKSGKWWRNKLAYKDLWVTPEKAFEIGIIDEVTDSKGNSYVREQE